MFPFCLAHKTLRPFELVPKPGWVLEQALGKSGGIASFSTKFKVVVPKTEVLEQPHS
jgi:hypothetical protein